MICSLDGDNDNNNIDRAFAEAQMASLHEFETELYPGLITGQRLIPVGTAGCYVPGGRYRSCHRSSGRVGEERLFPGNKQRSSFVGVDQHVYCRTECTAVVRPMTAEDT